MPAKNFNTESRFAQVLRKHLDDGTITRKEICQIARSKEDTKKPLSAASVCRWLNLGDIPNMDQYLRLLYGLPDEVAADLRSLQVQREVGVQTDVDGDGETTCQDLVKTVVGDVGRLHQQLVEACLTLPRKNRRIGVAEAVALRSLVNQLEPLFKVTHGILTELAGKVLK